MPTGNLAIESPSDHYALLHPDQSGTVVIWEHQAANKRWRKLGGDNAGNTDAILHGLTGTTDAFISVSQFHGWRLQRLLKSLRSNFVDLDLGRPATHQDLDDALELLRERAMPSPSAAIFSGRGMHLYWLTTHTPAQALPVWQAVEDALIGALSDLHADHAARDCTRVLRLAGSVNGKCGADVRGLVLDRTPWTLHQLADEVLGHRPPKPAPRRAAAVRSLDAARIKRRKGGLAATNLRRWHLVLQDLHRIGRHHGEIQEGYRNEFLFLSSVALSWFAAPDSIAAEVADMADLYCPSLPSGEVMTAAAQSVSRARKAAKGARHEYNGAACDARYRYRRLKLWERLEGIAEPILHQLRAILPDNVRAAHERERQQGRDRVAEGRHQSHRRGRRIDADSAAQLRPWEAQGVSRATYYRQRK